MMHKEFRWITLAALALGSGLLSAQSVDTGILGKTTDTTGAVVVGASVTITQPSTGFTRTLTSGQDGNFELRYLSPGEYTVEASAPGFRSERRTGVVLQIGQQARLDFTLQVGGTTEAVEVTAAGVLLQTENASLGEVVTSERIKSLPLNGRNFVQLGALTPGVTVSGSGAGSTAGRFSANGARDVNMQVSFDGVTAVNNRQNFVAMFPSIDAIQEFKVQTGNYSAEYGGNAGANVQLQLKSGTNQYHGTLLEFLRNDLLDARGYFRPEPLPKNILRRNQFGGVFSGPIKKDKTFFMLGYEGLRVVDEEPITTVVLTPEQRRGDFSAKSTPIIDPRTGNPFPGNIIPTDRLDPVSMNIINTYMPLPNQPGVTNYAGVSGSRVTQDQVLTRIDHSFSERDQIFGHYIYQRGDYPSFGVNPNFLRAHEFNNQSVAVQEVHTFSPTLLNEIRFGYQRGFKFRRSPLSKTGFKIEDLGINGFNIGGPNGRPLSQEESGFPIINIAGYMGMGDSTDGEAQDFSRTFQMVDNLSVIRGAHAMKMGVDIRRMLGDANTTNAPYGRLDFTNDIADDAAAAFMLGYPRTSLTPEGIPISAVRQWRYGFYFQDDWKVTQRLTLNLGARYDLFLLPKDVNGNSRTLRFDLDPSGPVLWPEPGQVVDLWKNEFWHIAPRFGFAYRVNDKTSLRGGYGIFTAAAHFDNINTLQTNPPFGASITATNPALNPVATIQNPVPSQLVSNPVFNVVSVEPDRQHKNGYLQNWNLQIGRELSQNDILEVGYVGTKGTFLDTSVTNWNSPLPGAGDVQARRPYPNFGRIRMWATDGNSIYHALQTRFEHRMSHGLSLSAAYTWSHMIDDQQGSLNGDRSMAQNPRLRGKAERANSAMDIRHRLVIGGVWEVPLRDSLKGVAKSVLGGWSLGGIATFQSGMPLNITQSEDSQNVDSTGESRPNLMSGQNAVLSSSIRTPDRWFNTNAFTPSVLEYGNSPRNPAGLVGPGLNTFDLSASKSFKMPYSESHELMFRAEFFNAFNTPQFSNPDTALGNETFGRVTSTSNPQRQIQLALKYSF